MSVVALTDSRLGGEVIQLPLQYVAALTRRRVIMHHLPPRPSNPELKNK
jgi:hypothetical protein